MQNPDRTLIKSLIAAFTIAVIVLIIHLLRERSPFGGKNTSFAVNEKIEISRIDLSDGTKSVILEKKKEGWFVNEKYEARKSAVISMIKLLKEIQIKSPVNQRLFEEDILNKEISPVRVRIFMGERLVKSFLVYRTGSNLYGNIMKMRISAKPYIVSLPGIEAELGSFFSTDELFWQPYVLFSLLPSEISSIKVENISDKVSSFSIRNNKNRFLLSDSSRELSGWDTSHVVRYVSYFTHVPFEAPAIDLPAAEIDTIGKANPLFRITVDKTDGTKVILTLWERWHEQNGLRKKDTDRLWAKISDREGLFIVRYMDIDPILKKISYFFTG